MTIEKPVIGEGSTDLKEKNLEGAGAEVLPEVDDADDKVVSDGIAPLLEGNEEEDVTIKRGALKKLHTNKENYKTVVVAVKKKQKETVVAPVVVAPKEEKPEDKFVTKESVRLDNQKAAIKQATVADEKNDDTDTQALKKEINDNWEAIKAFYTGKGGKDDVSAIYEDILDAHAAWKRRFGSSGKKDTTGSKTVADLAASRGNGGSGKNNTTTTRKRILPVSGSPKKTWYPDAAAE